MARLETRDVIDELSGLLEPLIVDLDNPDALLPRGSVLLCEAGHAAAIVANSVLDGQVVVANDFAPLQIGMDFRDGEPFPLCQCGARLVRDEGRRWSLHVQGRGWI